MNLVSSPEKVDLREVLIIRFHTYLSFSAWLLLQLTIPNGELPKLSFKQVFLKSR